MNLSPASKIIRLSHEHPTNGTLFTVQMEELLLKSYKKKLSRLPPMHIHILT